MWAYRKMMEISLRENKTNEEVLTLADEQLYIIPTIKKRKITYFDHMIRRNNIHRLEGPLEGKRSWGRPRTEWMTNITEWTGMRYEDLVRLAQDHREPCRIMTANLLKEDCTWWWWLWPLLVLVDHQLYAIPDPHWRLCRIHSAVDFTASYCRLDMDA